MQTRAKAFNPQIFLEFLCYSVFAGLMFYLVGSGKYLSYVTPRMKPYLYFSAVVMLIWAFAVLGRLFRPQHKIRSAHCFVLVIPILFVLLPHRPLRTSDLSARYIGGNALAGLVGRSPSSFPQKQVPPGSSEFSTSANTPAEYPAESITAPADSTSSSIEDALPSIDTTLRENNTSDSRGTTVPDVQPGKLQDNVSASTGAAIPNTQPDKLQNNVPGSTGTAIPNTQPDKLQNNVSGSTGTAVPNTQPGVSDDEYVVDLPGLDAKNKKITVGNDYFYAWISELYVNMEKYEGYKLSITGFVFKDSEFMADNEFVPARLTMTCCAADLAPFGLLCQYDKVSALKSESWVTVEGIIHIGKSTYREEPQIIVTKITPAEAVEGYVYPF